MRCLELFAGAGGAAEGLRRVGLHGAHVEWDADACATLRAAGFDDVREGDVRALLASGALDDCRGVDVLWASPPCQPFSSAGKRQGATDERDGWPWTLDAIDRLRPTWLLAENVSGMTHHAKGHGERCAACYLERLLVALRERFAHVQHAVLDAADYGVPQRRRRLIVIAGPHAVPWPAATHARVEGLFGLARWRSLGEALGIGGLVAMEDGQRSHAPGRPQRITPANAPSPAARNGNGSGPRVYIQHMEGAPRPASEAAPSVGTKGNMFLHRPSPCVSAVGEEKGSGAGGHPEKLQRASDALYLATGRRRLTVAECATIQAFPPGWPFAGNVGAQYRQVGNAVPPPLAEAVGRALLRAMWVAA